MKRSFSALAFSSLAVVGALANPMMPEARAQAPVNAPTVLVQPAYRLEISRRSEFVGKIEAVEKVAVRVRVTGTLLTPRFKDGQPVEVGQLLYEIEPASFQADVDAKKAQLASARALARNAEVSFERARSLLRTQAASKAIYDQRKAELDQANAAVSVAAAALEDAEITLGYTKIFSPISGRIGRTAVTGGNIVSPSSGVLTTIVKDDEVYAVFAVSQREILEYRKRAATNPPIVKLHLADGSTYGVTSRIDYIENTVDATTNSQILRATFGNPERLLVNDQTARVIVEEPADKAEIVVPQAVLSADQTGTFVMVVDGEGKVATKYVETGPARDGMVVILSGLEDGDLVVVMGAQRVRPGMAVNVEMRERADADGAQQDKTGR